MKTFHTSRFDVPIAGQVPQGTLDRKSITAGLSARTSVVISNPNPAGAA